MIHHKIAWSTSYDMDNKLIIYHTNIPGQEWRINKEVKDPDGIPLFIFAAERVIRVRKMTDKEFEECVKEYGYKFDINVEARILTMKGDENVKS